MYIIPRLSTFLSKGILPTHTMCVSNDAVDIFHLPSMSIYIRTHILQARQRHTVKDIPYPCHALHLIQHDEFLSLSSYFISSVRTYHSCSSFLIAKETRISSALYDSSQAHQRLHRIVLVIPTAFHCPRMPGYFAFVF